MGKTRNMKKIILGVIHLLEEIVHIWHFHIYKQWRI